MPLICNEIFVGERSRSMVILASSLPDSSSRKLAHHLDLPGQPPQGFLLDTYVSGLTIDEYYIISRTSKDPDAQRAGMVFSHAFVFDKKEIEKLSDIRAVFRLLKRDRPLEFSPSQRTINTAPSLEPNPPGLVCDMLTTKPIATAVIANPEIYEDIIARVWAKLLPSMRSGFRFKLSFDPKEAARENLNFALVPPATLARWKPVCRVSDLHTPASTLAGQSLSASDGGRLITFVDDLELDQVKLDMFGLIGKACELYSTYPSDFSSSLAALRIVGSLQTNPNKAKIIKEKLVESVVSLPGPKGLIDLLSLRNLDWSFFSLSRLGPTDLQEKFIECFQLAEGQTEKIHLIKSIFNEGDATDEWRESGMSALSTITPSVATGIAPASWEILQHEKSTGESLLRIVPNKILDNAMAALSNIVASHQTTELHQLLAKHQFYRTEVALLRKSYSNDMSALTVACQRDRKLFGDVAILEILANLSDMNKLLAAVDIGDEIILEAAAKVVADTPSVLSSFNLCNEHIQIIWNDAISMSRNAWKIHKELTKTQDSIWETINGKGIKPSLLESLMDTPVGNWSKHKYRSKIWSYLSGEGLRIALDRTAIGWITSLPSIASDFKAPLEPTLAEVIASSKHHTLLLNTFSNSTFDETLDVFFSNDHLSEELFSETLIAACSTGRKLLAVEAERAGRLAFTRNWQSLTRRLFERLGTSSDLRPFFRICVNHLSYWDRFASGFEPPSPSDITELLLETASELYPSGPIDNDIWERAGGNTAHLDRSGNGRDQWNRALRKIRLGGPVSAKNLLRQMLTDYPWNSQLKQLKEII